MSEPERYESILRLAWRVGWTTAREAYVERELSIGRDNASLREELTVFDRLYYAQSVRGVDPVAALRRRDLSRFVMRPLSVMLAAGVAFIFATVGVDAPATLMSAGLTFAMTDAGTQALVRTLVR